MAVCEYECDEQGRITSPGKFEGEMCYLPYFYDLFLCGEGYCDDEGVISIDVEDADRVLYPSIPEGAEVIFFMESESVFVYEV
jgi:hypothetical protein